MVFLEPNQFSPTRCTNFSGFIHIWTIGPWARPSMDNGLMILAWYQPLNGQPFRGYTVFYIITHTTVSIFALLFFQNCSPILPTPDPLFTEQTSPSRGVVHISFSIFGLLIQSNMLWFLRKRTLPKSRNGPLSSPRSRFLSRTLFHYSQIPI